jgi:hypothetical protein
MKMTRINSASRLTALALFAWLALPGCISAPNVVLVDQKTALEQQAAGEFRALEFELERAGSPAKPEDIPGDKLETNSRETGEGRLGELARLTSIELGDAQRIDQFLAAHCMGEALDGSLQQTPKLCRLDVDGGQLTRLLERTNLHRRQLWSLLASQNPGTTETQAREAWRKRNLQRVICGGLIQVGDGAGQPAWEGKKC